jgi:hypothetical protein
LPGWIREGGQRQIRLSFDVHEAGHRIRARAAHPAAPCGPRGSVLTVRYERLKQRLATRPIFLRRLALSVAIGVLLIAVSLGLGMLGYHYLLDVQWIDAFTNAAMILSGMGPIDRAATWWGKFFTGMYALYSGLAVIAIAGIIFAPVVHRFLHYLHADPGDTK